MVRCGTCKPTCTAPYVLQPGTAELLPAVLDHFLSGMIQVVVWADFEPHQVYNCFLARSNGQFTGRTPGLKPYIVSGIMVEEHTPTQKSTELIARLYIHTGRYTREFPAMGIAGRLYVSIPNVIAFGGCIGVPQCISSQTSDESDILTSGVDVGFETLQGGWLKLPESVLRVPTGQPGTHGTQHDQPANWPLTTDQCRLIVLMSIKTDCINCYTTDAMCWFILIDNWYITVINLTR